MLYLFCAVSALSVGLLIGYVLGQRSLAGKHKDELRLLEQMAEIKTKFDASNEVLSGNNKAIGDFKDSFTQAFEAKIKDITQANDANSTKNREAMENLKKALTDTVDTKLKTINDATQNAFTTYSKISQDSANKLAEVSEGVKRIDNLSKDILAVKNMLDSGGKHRGDAGELVLDSILSQVFGRDMRLYSTQETIRSLNGNVIRPDAIINLPDSVGRICIDSKNYQGSYDKMCNARDKMHEAEQNMDQGAIDLAKKEFENAQKAFKGEVWKNVKDVGEKYIIPGVTASFAIVFIPSEEMFREFYLSGDNVEKNAHTVAEKRNVFIASPLNLIHICHIANSLNRQAIWDKESHQIRAELRGLGEEFKRYSDRWDGFLRRVDRFVKDTKEIGVTSSKISEKFKTIESRAVDKTEMKEDVEIVRSAADPLQLS